MNALFSLSEAQIQTQVRQFLAGQGIDSIHFANGAVLAGDKIALLKKLAELVGVDLSEVFPNGGDA